MRESHFCRALAVTSAVLSTVVLAASAGPSGEETIRIRETKDSFKVSVPVSRLVMTIPKEGFTRQEAMREGSMNSPRYFIFENKAEHTLISGWFEPDVRFKGAKQLWEEETAAWRKKHMPSPQDVSFQTIGGWDAVVYDIAVPIAGASNSHIRAHWVQAGTWIDLHMSVTSDRPNAELREKLIAQLKRIRVKEKK